MDSLRILSFLSQLAANNSRPWFQEHKDEYDAVREEWMASVEQMVRRITVFDATVAHLQAKDCVYRINRDTRFSPDKSPYKTHFGAFINAHGKKSLRGGYYIHLEPGHCLLAVGNYWLPTNILTACRNEIMANEQQWLRHVRSEAFLRFFDGPSDADFEHSPQGFGMARLKTCPSGFPRDYEYVEYLRLKDYCAWHAVPDSFFLQPGWLDQMAEVFEAGKDMQDFINAVIDDYE